jgi:hypothetical protein
MPIFRAVRPHNLLPNCLDRCSFCESEEAPKIDVPRDRPQCGEGAMEAAEGHGSRRITNEGTANFAFVEPEREYGPVPFGRHSACTIC